MSESVSSVQLQFIALTRTQDWLKSTTGQRKAALTAWAEQPYRASRVTWVILDDKGAIVRFASADPARIRLVREWAAAHPGSVAVLP